MPAIKNNNKMAGIFLHLTCKHTFDINANTEHKFGE